MSEGQDKDIPSFGTEVADTRLRQKLEAMREAVQKLMGTRGRGGGRAAVRWDDLREGGLLTETGRILPPGGTTTVVVGGGGGGGTPPDEPDLTKPPTPTGLSAVAGLGNVLVEWDAPVYSMGHGHKQTNVYATKQPGDDNTAYTINDAVRVDSAVGPLTVLALPSDLNIKWRLWIRYETNDGVESDPAGGVNGIVVTTGRIGNADLGDLVVQARNLADGAVDLMGDAVKADASFGAIAVGYTVTQYLVSTSGVLENLIVGNAQISELSAAKLTAGDGTIGGNLKSSTYSAVLQQGWIVRPDGFAEFNDIVVRGTVFASQGAIGGSLIGSNYIQSTNWVNLSTGWRWNNNGTGQVGGIAILTDRIQSGNYSENAQGFAWRADGTGQIGGLKVTATGIESSNFVSGSAGLRMNFDGQVEALNLFARGNIQATSLNAATGTFSGVLTADAVNAVNTINIAENAVTVPVAAQAGNTTFDIGTGYVFVTSPSADFGAQPVVIIGYVTVRMSGTAGTEPHRLRLRRNGTTIAEFWFGPGVGAPGVRRTHVSPVFIDNPGPGSHTYSFVFVDGGDATTNAAFSSLVCLGVKR